MSSIRETFDVNGNIDVSIRHAVTKEVCRNVTIDSKDFAVVKTGMPFEIVVTADLKEPPTALDIEFCVQVKLFGKTIKTISRKIEHCREPIIINSVTTDLNSSTKQRMVSAMVFRAPHEVESTAIDTTSQPLVFTFSMCYGRSIALKSDFKIKDMTLTSTVVDASKECFERPTITVSAVEKHVCNVPTHVFKPLGEKKVITKWVETATFIVENIKKRYRETEIGRGEWKRIKNEIKTP